MTQPLLEIDNLSIAFRQQGKMHTVVSEFLDIGAGETLALVGESGSGKSVSALSVLRLLPLRRSATPAEIFAFTVSRCSTPMSAR
jgi:microcin C transport system ATP-binding protein